MRQRRGRLFLVFVMCAILAVSAAWSGGTFQSRNDGRLSEPIGPAVSSKVTLCHKPPGNPANAQTITVGQAAVAAHLAHGDYLGACAAACSGPPAAVPKTGQTTCSDEFGNSIDCAGTGQDGEYQKGVSVDPRFTDNGDGTVKDNLTGLIWLKDASCLGYMQWADALSSANTLASGACGLTDGSVAGDWRLPNVKELQSLIDFGQSFPALPPGHPFAGVQSSFYWSSTSGAGNEGYAWFVFLGYGFVNGVLKTGSYYVWPVRGGQ